MLCAHVFVDACTFEGVQVSMGIGCYPAGETDVCGTWVLGFEFWPLLLSSNCSEPPSHPSSPGFRVLKELKFLVAVIVTYFNHFQSDVAKRVQDPGTWFLP